MRRRLNPMALLVMLIALGALIAMVRLWMGDLGDEAQRQAVLEIRLLRIATACIVGAALAVAGVLLQSLLRNPLASPELLGLASGAGLGVMAAVYAAFLAGAGLADPGGLGATGAAILGACATLGLVYALSQKRGFIEPLSLVLVGVVIGMMCGAGITLLQHLLPDQGIAARRLLVGALRDDAASRHLWLVGVLTLGTVVLSSLSARQMDQAALGDDEAVSVGVNLRRLRAVQFACAGILTAGAVVLAGPIGFVGLVCPHAVRLASGPRHSWLIVNSAVAGACMVAGADLIVAVLKEAVPALGRVPISVITALVGGPVFVIVLRSKGGHQFG